MRKVVRYFPHRSGHELLSKVQSLASYTHKFSIPYKSDTQNIEVLEAAFSNILRYPESKYYTCNIFDTLYA